MNRLLQRMRAGNEPSENARTESTASRRDPEVQVERDVERTEEAEQAGKEPGHYLPRRQAPELVKSLAHMRALANDTARSAILSHAKRSHSNRMQKRVGSAVIVVLASVASAFYFGDNLPISLTCAAVGAIAAACLAWQTVAGRKQFLRSFVLQPPEKSQAGTTDEGADSLPQSPPSDP
jgi:hypothetical protein